MNDKAQIKMLSKRIQRCKKGDIYINSQTERMKMVISYFSAVMNEVPRKAPSMASGLGRRSITTVQ